MAKLKVKAKGKAKQKDTLIRTEMEDGTVTEEHEYESKTKVKKFFCEIVTLSRFTAARTIFLKEHHRCRQARDGGRHRGPDHS